MEALDALPKNARTPDKPAAQFLALIAKLYAVESHAQDCKLSTQERLRYRQQHSAAVLGHIQTLLLAHLHSVVPGSSLGKALHYLSAQWPKLSRYVEDGSYPIDNFEGKAQHQDFAAQHRKVFAQHEFDGFIGHMGCHAVVDSATRQDDLGVIANLLRLVR